MIEERLLVFLVVLVVRERLCLHQRDERHEAADDAPALAADELGNIGILLLRHDRAAGAEAVGEPHEAVARAGPQDQLLGEARKVHHDERGGGGEFDREIAVGDGVERIGAETVEAELARDALAIDRVAGPRERCGAQRQPVDALAAVREPLHVAREHRVVGEQVVAESDGLRDLQVREAGHDRVGVALREIEERPPQSVRVARTSASISPRSHSRRSVAT